MTPSQVAQNKKRIQNKDGSVSTERSITVGSDNGFINIPSVRNGVQLSQKDAISSSRTDGVKRPRFKTIAEAVKAAKKRSNDIGNRIAQRKP